MAKKQKKPPYATEFSSKVYEQESVRKRIEAAFLDNVGKIITRDQLSEVARKPGSTERVENWHQRLSELRTDFGYVILSHRDRNWLRPGEYLMESAKRSSLAKRRIQISPQAWEAVLRRAGDRCEWSEGRERCLLKAGDTDPIGGGTVRLTPDHKSPHSTGSKIDPNNAEHWMALCGRHQVVKKNFWDHTTGKLNTYAIVQAATKSEKRQIYEFLKRFFGDE